MKRWLVVLGIVAVVLALLAAGNRWAQARATRKMNDTLQRAVAPVLANPQNLKLENTDVRLTRDGMTIPKIEITGSDLELKNSPVNIESTRVEINDVEITGTGKERKVTHVGESRYEVTLSATDMTSFLRTQPAMDFGDLRVEAETVTLTLSQQHGVTIAGEGTHLTLNQRGEFKVNGVLALENGRITFLPRELIADGQSFSNEAARTYPTPIEKALPPALQGEVTEILVEDNRVTFKGRFDGTALLRKR